MYSKKKLWICLFKCFLWIFKVQWVQENQGVRFLMVPPKDVFTQLQGPHHFTLACTLNGMDPTPHAIMPKNWRMWLEANLTSAGLYLKCPTKQPWAYPTLGLHTS
jgi:hypothetical protein